MPHHPATLLLLAGLMALLPATDSQTQDTSRGQAPAPATPKYTTLTDVPEGERREMDAFARQLEAAFLAQDIPKIQAAFDGDGMVEQLMTGVNASGPGIEDFKTGMKSGMARRFELLSKRWSEHDVRYKHLVIHQGMVKPRFRLATNTNGIIILDFLVTRGPNGKLGIVDVYHHAWGSSFADQMRQTSLPALMDLDKDYLKRTMRGGSGVNDEDLRRIANMVRHLKSENYRGVADTYHLLSPEMKGQLVPTFLYLGALQRLPEPDLNAYKNTLEAATATHRSANFQLMLLTLYTSQKNHDKAIECVDSFMTAVEKDAGLLTIRGILQLNKGSLEAASASIREALALEPDSFFVHTRGLDVLLAAKDYSTLAASMRWMEENSSHRFKGTLDGPAWADFLKRPESKPWR